MGCTFHRPAKRTLPPSRGSRVGGRGAVLSVVGAGVWRGVGGAPRLAAPAPPPGGPRTLGVQGPGKRGDRKTRLSARAVAFLTRDPPGTPLPGGRAPPAPPAPASRTQAQLRPQASNPRSAVGGAHPWDSPECPVAHGPSPHSSPCTPRPPKRGTGPSMVSAGAPEAVASSPSPAPVILGGGDDDLQKLAGLGAQSPAPRS